MSWRNLNRSGGASVATAVQRVWVWGSTAIGALALFVACGGGGGSDDRAETTQPPPAATTTVVVEDIEMQPEDFPNLHELTKVGNHYVGNLLGHLDETLAVANSPDGGRYPVGTIIQLVPQEAMVKRAEGWSPATNDWEFFFLDVSAEGTTIVTRGVEDVANRFGGNCAACHGAADPQWDFVCNDDHGCAPLGLDQNVITAIQEADPRP